MVIEVTINENKIVPIVGLQTQNSDDFHGKQRILTIAVELINNQRKISYPISCKNILTSSQSKFTYNILHGATLNNNFDLEKIANVINSVSPDLVALQEVDFKTNRANKMDLVSELGKLTDMAPLFGKAMNEYISI